MITIRDKQMKVLADALLPAWLDIKLRELFPEECAVVGPSGWTRLIEEGIRRARVMGFGPDQFLPYLSLEVCFGAGFRENPENDWARQAWADGQGSPAERVERLRRAAIFHIADLAEADLRNTAAERENPTAEATASASDTKFGSEF
jgi:hypothetical protein